MEFIAYSTYIIAKANDDDDGLPSCCGINKLTHIYYTYKLNTTRNTVCI